MPASTARPSRPHTPAGCSPPPDDPFGQARDGSDKTARPGEHPVVHGAQMPGCASPIIAEHAWLFPASGTALSSKSRAKLDSAASSAVCSHCDSVMLYVDTLGACGHVLRDGWKRRMLENLYRTLCKGQMAHRTRCRSISGCGGERRSRNGWRRMQEGGFLQPRQVIQGPYGTVVPIASDSCAAAPVSVATIASRMTLARCPELVRMFWDQLAAFPCFVRPAAPVAPGGRAIERSA